MAMLTPALYRTLRPRMLKGLSNAISSPASGGGRLRSNSPNGRQIELFGPGAVHANHSRQRAKEWEQKMNAISGPISPVSSRSVSLQQSLANRLLVRMDVNGSPEYALTWNHWDMPSGPPICALRASERRTSGSGFGGWPTPAAQERLAVHKPGSQLSVMKLIHGLAPDGKGRPGEIIRHGTCLTPGVVVNVEHYRWLMGFPKKWERSRPTETR